MQLLLPRIEGKPLIPDCFPTRMQAFIFRNWGSVPVARLADVLQTTEDNVTIEAERMGLQKQNDLSLWSSRGYLTIIRSNWHLLNYRQLLQLLDWSEDKLALILKEEDFFEHKLGDVKPDCEEITYRPLTAKEENETKKIRAVMERISQNTESIQKREPFIFSYEEKDLPDTVCDFIENRTGDMHFSTVINRFEKTLSPLRDDGRRVFVSFLKEKEEEYHEILVSEKEIGIYGGGFAGALRGLYRMEGIVNTAKENKIPYMHRKWTPQFGIRAIYPYSASYQNMLEGDAELFCSDALLEEYARVGINAIWIPAILYQITVIPFASQLSDGWEKRIQNLRSFTQRASNYGIKILLYMNEPRSLPLSAFEKNPTLKGAVRGRHASLCIQNKEVLSYLTNGIESICRTVPELGGFFFILLKENLTHCKSKPDSFIDIPCEKCRDASSAELTLEVIKALGEGVRRGGAHMKTMFWDWGWFEEAGFSAELLDRCIEAIPENGALMCQRESGIEICRGGVPVVTSDYAMSVDGLSECSVARWRTARKLGRETAVKLQINNTWECSGVPYIPVFQSLIRQIEAIQEEKVDHLLLSWTLGGYPSPNIRIASELFFKEEGAEVDYQKPLRACFGADSEKIWEATAHFSRAFGQYPFDKDFAYVGPTNSGVANPFYETPTGRRATMTCYTYDDLRTWCLHYPADVLEKQFGLLCDEWEKGLRVLGNTEVEIRTVAEACYIQFRSVFHQIRFIRLRDRFLQGDTAVREELLSLIRAETELAERMYALMRKMPEIGFEAANHYYFDIGAVQEKMVNLAYLTEHFAQ